MSQPVLIEGFEGQNIAVEPGGFFGSSKLLLNGQPAPPGLKKGHYTLRRNDGQPVAAHFKGGFPDPAPILVVGEQKIAMAEPLAWYQWLWAGLPLFLLFLGGALGGALGAVATTVNANIFRSALPNYAKWGLCAITTWVAFVIYFLLALLFQMMIGGRS